MGFSGGSDGKESACNVGHLGSIPGLGRFPGGGHGNPLQHCCLENPHGQKSLAGYSPWGRKESDMTEHSTGMGHTQKQRILYLTSVSLPSSSSKHQVMVSFTVFLPASPFSPLTNDFETHVIHRIISSINISIFKEI